MLVRSSKYFEALTRLHAAELAVKTSTLTVREAKLEAARMTRELQELRADEYHRLRGKRIILHLKDEISIEGWLFEVYADTVVLANARVPISGSGEVQILDGHQHVERRNIAWVQEPTQ